MSPRDLRRIAERYPARPRAADRRPVVLDRLRVVACDVRGDIERGEEPFATIMSAVRRLAEDETLAIRAPFEPVPLYDVLARRGFRHWTERVAPGDCTVWFYREAEAVTASAAAAVRPATAAASNVLDVRGLEPPLPMVTVLERLDTLGPGEALVVLHERRPMFLYPQLEARGFRHDTDEPEAGMVRITIRRPEA